MAVQVMIPGVKAVRWLNSTRIMNLNFMPDKLENSKFYLKMAFKVKTSFRHGLTL